MRGVKVRGAKVRGKKVRGAKVRGVTNRICSRVQRKNTVELVGTYNQNEGE